MVLSFVLCELITQVLKRLADQPRPTASIPGLDVHGYPKDPFGNAYPSAHTSCRRRPRRGACGRG